MRSCAVSSKFERFFPKLLACKSSFGIEGSSTLFQIRIKREVPVLIRTYHLEDETSDSLARAQVRLRPTSDSTCWAAIDFAATTRNIIFDNLQPAH